mgnify:FL=1
MITSYSDMIDFLHKSYPDFDITMGSTNALRSPAIIIRLTDVTVRSADSEVYNVVAAEYEITWYVESTADFNPLPAVSVFGNLTQGEFDSAADGEIFQAGAQIIGPNCLWNGEK